MEEILLKLNRVKAGIEQKIDSLATGAIANLDSAFASWRAPWTAARAEKLDRLDAAVSSRASQMTADKNNQILNANFGSHEKLEIAHGGGFAVKYTVDGVGPHEVLIFSSTGNVKFVHACIRLTATRYTPNELFFIVEADGMRQEYRAINYSIGGTYTDFVTIGIADKSRETYMSTIQPLSYYTYVSNITAASSLKIYLKVTINGNQDQLTAQSTMVALERG